MVPGRQLNQSVGYGVVTWAHQNACYASPFGGAFASRALFRGEFKGQMKVTKLVPLVLFLAGCSSTNGPLDAVERTSSGGVLVLVEKLDLAENSYLLTPSAQDSFLTPDSDLKQ